MTTTLSERAVARTSGWLARRVGRRSFLARVAVVGSVLAVNPFRYLLRPGTAYAALCGPAADCGSGWSAMCCSINQGKNSCPPGSIPGGWWKVDNSGFCGNGPRYYVDCNATCGSCGCGSSGICAPSCSEPSLPLQHRLVRSAARRVQPVPVRAVQPAGALCGRGRLPGDPVHAAVAVRRLVLACERDLEHDAPARRAVPPRTRR